MAAYVFPDTKFPEVRAAIGTEVDETLLPDEVLAMNIYEGEAERWIMSNLTEDQWTTSASQADYAATNYIAGLVAPTLRLISEEKLPAGFMKYEASDLSAMSAKLLQQANDAITAILGDDATTEDSVNPNFFGLAHRRFPPTTPRTW